MTLTRLQPQMCVLYQGVPHRVVLVNECRALLEPLARQLRTIIPKTGAHAGRAVQIWSTGPRHSVSPDSELPILSKS